MTFNKNLQNNLVSYSRLSPKAVESVIQSHYPVSDKIVCEYYVTGLHDNYMIHDGQTKTLLRVYRETWRTEPEIRFELELLLHLKKQDTSSAHIVAPLLTLDNNYLISFECPEAMRFAALFPFIAGDAPMLTISSEQSKILGKTIATIHLATSSFETRYHRKHLNLKLLLDDSVHKLLSALTTDQQQILVNIQNDINNKIPKVAFESPFACFCTGDVNATNFHINNNHITVFDFDQCGYGLRSFEIAKFFSYLLKLNNPQRSSILQHDFLTGYQTISKLDETEIQAIPYYISVSIIWVMAIHFSNIEFIGAQHLSSDFWSNRMSLLINNLPPELL